MIIWLDIFSFFLDCCSAFVFFTILRTFLPLRGSRALRIPAFLASIFLVTSVIYSNDLAGLLGTLVGFVLYVVIFYRAGWMEKLAAILVFYPALVAVNYLMLDISGYLFFRSIGISPGEDVLWTPDLLLTSTVFHTAALFLRLLFWTCTWLFLKKYLCRITSNLTPRMWCILDILMLASFVAVFTILYFMPEKPAIVYPICGASIFSSFGCIYLTAYICNSVQTAYHVQELEMQQAYYRDRIGEEERVRSIYHDMKNHLLVLQAYAENSQKMQESLTELQNQLQAYENYYHTGNEFLDIIIRDKARAAQEKQIDFTPVIHFEDSMFMDSLDISTIFGNALDNAIEAVEKLPVSQRLVTAKANRIRDMLVIVIENTAPPEAFKKSKTSKKDTFLHGFGLPNIQKTAEKYGGYCNAKSENEWFTLKIIIPLPS